MFDDGRVRGRDGIETSATFSVFLILAVFSSIFYGKTLKLGVQSEDMLVLCT